jgi:hypothetical protein
MNVSFLLNPPYYFITVKLKELLMCLSPLERLRGFARNYSIIGLEAGSLNSSIGPSEVTQYYLLVYSRSQFYGVKHIHTQKKCVS